jgi:hypothetical protein
MDSTRTIPMALTSNATWTVAGTNNLEQYLFIVRLKSDNSFTVKGYTTFAGPSSDGLIDYYRFISWAKNNGSGVLMPYRQNGEKVWWSGSDRIQIAPSLTTGFVSYSLSTIIPTTYLKSWVLGVPANAAFVTLSYDGTNQCEAMYNGNTGNETSSELAPVSAIYAKYTSGNSAIIVNAITLRR